MDNTAPTTGQSLTLSADGSQPRHGGGYRDDVALLPARPTRRFRPAIRLVGTDDVGGLSASGTSVESVSLTAPSSAGTYYYGACVDAIINESDTNNNCSTWVQVTVGAPDLVVESPSVDNTAPTTGQSLTLSATVRNQGTGAATATTLRYYRSSTRRFRPAIRLLARMMWAGFRLLTRVLSRSSLTAPSSSGTYYYGACVESVSARSDTNNNCSTGVQVKVGAPDLVVESPSVDNTTPTPSQSLTLSATVRNQGTGAATATTLRYYRSSDATISKDDTACWHR